MQSIAQTIKMSNSNFISGNMFRLIFKRKDWQAIVILSICGLIYLKIESGLASFY